MTITPVELLELYEYKVEDIAQGKEPRGGNLALNKLRLVLIQTALPSQLAKRFRNADSKFRTARNTNAKSEMSEYVLDNQLDPISEFDPSVLFDGKISETSTPTESGLNQLQENIYWFNLERELQKTVRSFNQGKRDEMRIVFAVLQNLDEYSKTSNFHQDFNLSRFVLKYPIPSLSDPRVHLDDPEISRKLLIEFFQAAFSISNRLEIPPEESVPYMRRFAKRVLDSDGELQANKNLDLDSLRRAKEDAIYQNASPAAIRNLEERLQAAISEDRRRLLMIDDDKIRFGQAIETLTALLSKYLPKPKGDGALPEVPQRIFGSEDPEWAQQTIGPEDTLLNVALKPQLFKFAGFEISINHSGQDYGLSIDNQEHILEKNSTFAINLYRNELLVSRVDDLVHLRLEAKEAINLANSVAGGRLMAHLMWPGQEYGFLRLLRAFSTRLKGETQYSLFGPDSSSRYGEASVDSLQDFVRKGLDVVRSRIEANNHWPAYIQEAANSLELVETGRNLQREISEWVGFAAPTRIDLSGELAVNTLGETPLELQAGGVVLSLRYQDNFVYVSHAGSVPRQLHDVLVWPTGEGAVVLARDGSRVAHTVLYLRAN